MTLEGSRAPQSLLPHHRESRHPPAKFRDSVTAPPQKAHRGECLLLGRGREGWPGLQCLEGGGDPCLSSTFSVPGPTLPAHSPGRLSGEAPMCTGGCLRLPSPPAPLPCPAPAEPSLLPGSASVGNFPGHLYSRPRVNCLVSSLPIHRRVTLPGNFTPRRGGRGLQEWRADWGAGLDQECGHLRKTVIR